MSQRPYIRFCNAITAFGTKKPYMQNASAKLTAPCTQRSLRKKNAGAPTTINTNQHRDQILGTRYLRSTQRPFAIIASATRAAITPKIVHTTTRPKITTVTALPP